MEGRKSKDKKEVCRRKEGRKEEERKYVEKSINKDKRKEGMKGTKSVATLKEGLKEEKINHSLEVKSKGRK